MEQKKYRSIIQQIVLFPLTVLLLIMLIMVVSLFSSYANMEKQMLESNVNALQISLNQFTNPLKEIDNDFIQYITSNESYDYLSKLKEGATTNDYFLQQADTIKWLQGQIGNYSFADGVFCYYNDINLLIFQERNKMKGIHEFVRDKLQSEEIQYNHWRIVEYNNQSYLFVIKKYVKFYWGCWIPLKNVITDYALDENNLLGSVYIIDEDNNNTISDIAMNRYLKSNGKEIKRIHIGNKTYDNIIVSTENKDVYFGMLIPSMTIFKQIPYWNKIMFFGAILSLLLIPGIVYWLRTKIAKPLKEVDIAMKTIRKGDLEYRIPLRKKKKYDEYDRLIIKFNQMMDDINELEFNLFKTKIKEQKTELKYISQQIRPHFILNALNIIYTYEKDEFDLVKKMVLYLSEYFQYIVNLKVDFVYVEVEFRHIENYLKIQKERYPDRFEFTVMAKEDVKECLIPPLIIQTFTENCMKYAMKNNEKLMIYITATQENGKLKIKIEDTGNGFSDLALSKINLFIETRLYQDHLGVGIQNAIERLDILYQDRIEIKVGNSQSGGAMIELFLPMDI